MEDDIKFVSKWKTTSILVNKWKTIHSLTNGRRPTIYFANGRPKLFLTRRQPNLYCNGKGLDNAKPDSPYFSLKSLNCRLNELADQHSLT